MAREWTQRQLEAITKEGDLLVSAAAGAGKTAVLTERTARLISEGMGVDELLVVTFTKAAAAEMKERIEARINSLADEAAGSGDAERALALRRAAVSCGNANISTLHRFCLSVLHRNYHEAGIDPAVQVADTLDAELLASKALGEVLEQAYLDNERQKDPDFEALLTAVGNDANLEKVIRALYAFAVARPDPDAWLDEAVKLYTDDFSRAAELISAELIERSGEELKQLFDTAKRLRADTPEEFPKIAAVLDDDMSFMMALRLHPDYDEWTDALKNRKLLGLAWPRGVEEAEKAEVKAYRADYKKLLEELGKRFAHTLAEERVFAEKLAGPVACLRRLTGAFAARYAALKEEDGLIDFSDMEQLTLKVLKNEGIAREYRERFRCVFVDEYQDINPAQEAILSAVSRGNRFMVGDVKQSIYRFRQAEPGIFLEKYRGYRGEGGKYRIDLNSNFRSRTAVLDLTNMVFSELMRGGAVGEIDYSDNAALISGFPVTDGSPRGSAELVLIDPQLADPQLGGAPYEEFESEESEESTDAYLQASYAASRILEIMETSAVTEDGAVRRCRWGDFAILLRSVAGTASEWLRALSDAGIPCVSSAGSDFFEAIEVRLFIDLLRVIDNRRQDIPLLAVMRSPVFGFTDEELIHIRADYEGEDALDRVISAAEDPSAPPWGIKARAALEKIDEWRAWAKLLELGDLVSHVLDETSFGVFVSALKGGEARRRNLETLADTARRYSASGRGGLGGFIRYLDAVRGSASASSAPAPAADAVRLMTIHQSKGLEFPFVFIGGVTRGFNRSYRSDVGVFDAELGIGLCSVSGDRGDRSMLQRAISSREARRQNSEEMRVLYVAMTRAKERLIMLGVRKDAEKYVEDHAKPLTGLRIMKADRYADWLIGACFPEGADKPAVFPNGGELKLSVIGASAVRAGSTGLDEAGFERWQQEAAFADTSGLEALFAAEYPADTGADIPSKLSVTGLTRRQPEVNVRPRFMEGERPFTGAEIGTLTHRLMQLISIAPHDEASVRAELAALTEKGLFTEREAAAIKIPSVVGFFASELGKRLTASGRVEREREFNLIMKASELTDTPSSAPVMLQGVIDCCFIEDGRWVLIDHKTTHVDPGHTARTVAERYRRQLELYSAALEALTGLPVAEAYVYLLSSGEAVKM